MGKQWGIIPFYILTQYSVKTRTADRIAALPGDLSSGSGTHQLAIFQAEGWEQFTQSNTQNPCSAVNNSCKEYATPIAPDNKPLKTRWNTMSVQNYSQGSQQSSSVYWDLPPCAFTWLWGCWWLLLWQSLNYFITHVCSRNIRLTSVRSNKVINRWLL